MKAIRRLIVKVDKKFEDEIKLDGVTLYKDTSYDLEWNTVCYGKVVSACDPYKMDILAEDDFVQNVNDGDKLYFHYNVILDPDAYLHHDGEDYYCVDYHMAVALVRDGEIIPVGSHILIEPIEVEVTHSLLHIPEMSKKKETNRGRVVASNNPGVKAGDIVEYDPDGKFENTIEGRKVYAMFNSYVYFVYNN